MTTTTTEAGECAHCLRTDRPCDAYAYGEPVCDVCHAVNGAPFGEAAHVELADREAAATDADIDRMQDSEARTGAEFAPATVLETSAVTHLRFVSRDVVPYFTALDCIADAAPAEWDRLARRIGSVDGARVLAVLADAVLSVRADDSTEHTAPAMLACARRFVAANPDLVAYVNRAIGPDGIGFVAMAPAGTKVPNW